MSEPDVVLDAFARHCDEHGIQPGEEAFTAWLAGEGANRPDLITIHTHPWSNMPWPWTMTMCPEKEQNAVLAKGDRVEFHGPGPWRVGVTLGKDGQRVVDEILTEVDSDGTVRVLTKGYVPVTYLGKLHGYRLEASCPATS